MQNSYVTHELGELVYNPSNFYPSITLQLKIGAALFSPENTKPGIDPYDAIRAELESAIQEMKIKYGHA
jgi:hypothetical protein